MAKKYAGVEPCFPLFEAGLVRGLSKRSYDVITSTSIPEFLSTVLPKKRLGGIRRDRPPQFDPEEVELFYTRLFEPPRSDSWLPFLKSMGIYKTRIERRVIQLSYLSEILPNANLIVYDVIHGPYKRRERNVVPCVEKEIAHRKPWIEFVEREISQISRARFINLKDWGDLDRLLSFASDS